jgi:flagellar hook-length control protein FliK
MSASAVSPPEPRDLERASRPHAPATPDPPAARTPDAVHQVERLVRLDELRPRPLHDGGDMRLELSPEGLGRIEVHVSVHDDGVQANLLAQHDHAREALELHRPALEAALGRSSLRLDGFTVGLGEHRGGDAGGTPQEQRPPVADPRPVDGPAAPLPGPTRQGGLSLRA